MVLLAFYCWIGLTIGQIIYQGAISKKGPDWGRAARSISDYAITLAIFVLILSNQK